MITGLDESEDFCRIQSPYPCIDRITLQTMTPILLDPSIYLGVLIYASLSYLLINVHVFFVVSLYCFRN